MNTKKERPALQPTYQQHFKDRHYQSQKQRIRHYFEKNTASRFMCSVDTEISIQNVCRLTGELLKCNEIQVIRKDACKITKQRVQFLSCNKNLFSPNPQFSIFDEEERRKRQ